MLGDPADTLDMSSKDGFSHGIHAMDDQDTYQDSELPRSNSTAAALVSVPARPEV
jgi:hypothetical protein